MFESLFYLVAGGVLLYFGAGWLVSGSSALAKLYNVPSLIIGLTVVAYGTSATEVVVSIQASLSGHSEIALGNILGSNIANIGLILGTSAILVPAKVSGTLIRKEVPVLVGVTIFMLYSLCDGVISRIEGMTLMVLGLAYTTWLIIDGKRLIKEAKEGLSVIEEAAREVSQIGMPLTKGRATLLSILGLIVLVAGGSLFVDGASNLALSLGMSERLIGLTIVAIGTSVPELATSLIAAWRGHSDIAVGNVIGSNIFNIVLCLGSASIISPINSKSGLFAVDNIAVLLMTVTVAYMIRKDRHVTRAEGVGLFCGYALFIILAALF